MNNAIWNTSIMEIIKIFKGALASLEPWMNKAKIAWREGESYDDWDEITNVLYKNIVLNSLSYGINNNNIAQYNYSYNDYKHISFIAVKYNNNLAAFVSFINKNNICDKVKIKLLENYNFKVVDCIEIPFEVCEFVFIKNTNDGIKEIYDTNIEI